MTTAVNRENRLDTAPDSPPPRQRPSRVARHLLTGVSGTFYGLSLIVAPWIFMLLPYALAGLRNLIGGSLDPLSGALDNAGNLTSSLVGVTRLIESAHYAVALMAFLAMAASFTVPSRNGGRNIAAPLAYLLALGYCLLLPNVIGTCCGAVFA